jgi:hypothetical protein
MVVVEKVARGPSNKQECGGRNKKDRFTTLDGKPKAIPSPRINVASPEDILILRSALHPNKKKQ